ncbi:MAG: hypothetical protein EBR81_11665 [Proteobacteria bacterium]|nr:hypothetical protein [Pseudomonadota bacterium]
MGVPMQLSSAHLLKAWHSRLTSRVWQPSQLTASQRPCKVESVFFYFFGEQGGWAKTKSSKIFT